MAVTVAVVKKLVNPRYSREDGAASVAGDTTDGFTWTNDGKEVVVVQQSGTTSHDIIIKNSAGAIVQTVTLAAAVNSQMALGPFSVQKFGTAPVLVPAHAEVLFSVYNIEQFKTSGKSGVTAAGM